MPTHLLRFVFLSCLVAALAVGLGSVSPAQESAKAPKPFALIFGTVWDVNQRPVYGVPIKIRRADQKKAKWELVSDHRGEFAQRVPAGAADYIVWVERKPKKGEKDAKPIETKVHIDNDERQDIGLHLME